MTLCLQPKLLFVTEIIYEIYKLFYYTKWDGRGTLLFFSQQPDSQTRLLFSTTGKCVPNITLAIRGCSLLQTNRTKWYVRFTEAVKLGPDLAIRHQIISALTALMHLVRI